MVAISIIIPVYNVEKYLKKCIESLVNQTFKDFEIICVNDGSTDKSQEILNKYSQKYPFFKILNQDNMGAGIARNNGLKLAEGEYIQFLDGDDYFEPTMLEEMYNKAKEHNTDLIVCSAKKVNEFEEVIENSNPIWPIKLDITPLNTVFNRHNYPNEILNMFCVVPWNKLCKKDLLIKNGIEFQNLSSSNDIAFGHKVQICAERIVVFDKQLINYRYRHKESISKNRADNTINIIHSAKEVKDFLINRRIYKELEKSFIEVYQNHIRAGISLCNDEQYENFKKEFKSLYPDFYETFYNILNNHYTTLKYLNNFIGDKNVYLWGASNFLKKLLEKEEKANPNILGIIDKNEASWGKDFGNYKIFSPKILETNPADIVVTIYNNHEKAHYCIKKELENKFPKIKTLDNFFDANSGRHESEKKYCPFCNEKFWFKPYGIEKRENALCPICHSLERHRYLYYIYKLFIINNRKIKILHTAPEIAISKMFLQNKNIDYTSIDLHPEKHSEIPNCLKMNVLDLKFPDNTFDFVISNHVIEHIEDEEKFIKEITRVLKPNGKGIISAPYFQNLEKTYEDSTIVTNEARLIAYGQEDHVRKYGRDIFDRIGRYAKITPLNRNSFDGFLDNEMSINGDDAIFIIEKI